MALSPGRWLAAAIALCAISATLILRPSPFRWVEPDPERRELRSAEWDARARAVRAARVLRIVQIRDSLAALTGRAAPGDTGGVFLDRSITGSLAVMLRNIAGRATEDRPDQPRLQANIAFVVDSVEQVRGIRQERLALLNVEYLLPTERGHGCLVLVRVKPGVATSASLMKWRVSNLATHDAARALLGPCGFLQRYGPPSPSIAAWLGGGAWEFALSPVSQREIPPWPGPSKWTRSLRDDGWPLRGYIGLAGYSCVTGNADQCRDQALRVSSRDSMRHGTMLSDWILPGPNPRIPSRDFRDGFLGPRASMYLADMARSLGPERFASFWTSPLAPDEAFEQASGQDLGTWTADWARRMYGRYERGPGIDPSGALLGLVLASGSLAAALQARRRRQVG